MSEPQTPIHQELYRRLIAKPFEPFVIITNEGKRYEIVRKFQAALGQRIILIVPPAGDGSTTVRIDGIASLTPA